MGARLGILSRLFFGALVPAVLSIPTLYASIFAVAKCQGMSGYDLGSTVTWGTIFAGGFVLAAALVVNSMALPFMSSVRTKGRAFLFGFVVVLALCLAVAFSLTA